MSTCEKCGFYVLLTAVLKNGCIIDIEHRIIFRSTTVMGFLKNKKNQFAEESSVCWHFDKLSNTLEKFKVANM